MSFTEILIFLLERKKYSVGIPFLAGVVGFVIASFLPPYYKSEIRVILDTGTKSTNISSLLKGAPQAGLLGALGSDMQLSENEDLYLEIIDGRDVNLATIEKFRLDTIYKGAKYKETLLKLFYNDIKIDVDKLTGVVSCAYEAKNKELARDLVRYIVEEANAKYIKLRKERALQTIEQLKLFKQGIIISADSLSEHLISFYRDNNLLDLESQLKITIAALASHEEEINNLKISESNAGSNNSTAAELRKRRYILEKEAQKLRGEFSKEYLPSKNSVYINSDWAVEKIIEKGKLEMNFRRLLGTIETIEGSIIMEESNAAKNTPVIQIVQDAYLADYKSKPKRATWAVMAAALCFSLVNLLLITRAIYTGELKSENQENFKKILRSLRL